jgi:hypothetical protein
VSSKIFQLIPAHTKIFSREKCTFFSLITGQNQVRKQVNLSLPLKLRERSLQKVNKPEKIRGFLCQFLKILEVIGSKIRNLSHEKYDFVP